MAWFQVKVSFGTIISLFLADVPKNACLESHFQHCFADRTKAVFPLIFALKWCWRFEFLPSGSALPSLSGIVKTPTMVCPSFLSSLYTSWPNRLWPITAILILTPLCVLEWQTCAHRKMKLNGIFLPSYNSSFGHLMLEFQSCFLLWFYLLGRCWFVYSQFLAFSFCLCEPVCIQRGALFYLTSSMWNK